MQGKVKWFSEQKGYGFIVDDAGRDHHFHVSAVRGADLPRTGGLVTFEPQQGRKGPRAVNVVPLAAGTTGTSGTSVDVNDHRVTCAGCHRRMIPRIITGPPLVHGRGGWTPVPKRSICPFCATTYQTFPPSRGEKIGLAIFLTVFGIIAIGVLSSFLSHR